jgi:hypothetical protein
MLEDFLLTRVGDRGHSGTADAGTTPPINREKGIMCIPHSIRKRNDWYDDPEADKRDKSDDLVLLSVFIAIVLIWGAAFLLT